MRRLSITVILFYYLHLAANGIFLQPSAYHHATSGLSLLYPHASNSRVHPSLQESGVESSLSRLFGLPQLPLYNLHFAYQRAQWGISLGSSFLDNALYQEISSNFGLSYRWDNISLGSSLHYLKTATHNYSDNAAWPLQLSLAWQEPFFSTAFTFYNSFAAQLEQQPIPQILLWETALEITEKSKLGLGLEKENDFDFSLKIGSSYQILENFTILSSYQYQPDRLGVGVVFGIKKMEICYAIRTHPHLDLNHYISVHYEISH
ncbi:MAG: hypothetical protein R6U84_02095 [Candidatus Cloacimonadales bacterium]